MKKILLIATGGTIASKEKGNGLEPSITPNEMLSYVEYSNCKITSIQLLNVDSTDIEPSHWYKIADCIRENYDLYDGFVVTHGTDTLSYTSCAISYLIQHPDKPIVLTGSQKPIDAFSTDAIKNLSDSIKFACSDFGGVVVVFNGKVIDGVCAKKINSVDFDGFQSVNHPLVATIANDKIDFNFKSQNDVPKFYNNLNENVCIIKLTPSLSPEILKLSGEISDGIIIESYGTGGIPAKYYDTVKEISLMNKPVVIATQCIYGGTNLTKYKVGNIAKNELELLESDDMTIEHTLIKLMFTLANSKNINEIKDKFLKKC